MQEIEIGIRVPDVPEMKVTLDHSGLSGITIFADLQSDRDVALRALLNASDEIEALENAAIRAFSDVS
jgi:hypothetical protein